MVIGLLWGLYVLSVLIVTTIFLQVTIKDQQASIPNINNQMFDFIYVSHWILVAFSALMFIVGLFGGSTYMIRVFGSDYGVGAGEDKVKRSEPYSYIPV
jgi:hypothetical protein